MLSKLTAGHLEILEKCADKAYEWGTDERGVYFSVGGIPKSVFIKLYPLETSCLSKHRQPKFRATARYGDSEDIYEYRDILFLVMEFGQMYKDRGLTVGEEWTADLENHRLFV